MTKHRKYISTILILTLIIGSMLMTSCTSAEAESSKNSKAKTEQSSSDEKSNEKTDDKSTDSTDSSKSSSKSSSSESSQASASSSSSGGESTAAEYCYVTIEGYCSGMAIALQGGDTVYSVSTRTGASFSGSSSYVTGINGRMEKSEGSSSGWVYTVNGGQVWKPAGSCSVSSGDSVCWSFVK